MKSPKSTNQNFYTRFLFIVVTIVILYFVYQTSSTLLLLFLTYILSQGLSPVVTWVDDKTPLNRSFSVIGVSLIAFLAIFGISYLSVQILINDFTELLVTLPALVEDITRNINSFTLFDVTVNSSTIQNNLPQAEDLRNIGTSIVGSAISIGGNVVGMILTFITLAAITFYQVNNPIQVRNFLVNIFPKQHAKEAKNTIVSIEKKLGNWLLGQLSLVVILGICSYIGFKLFGLPFALPLAVIAGISDIVPVVGPIVTFIPLIIVAFATLSWPMAIGVVVYFLVIQQIEGNVVVPKIMESAVGLEGVIVIAALMLGSQLAGVLGALLAIPSAIVLKELYLTWQKHR